MTDTTLHAAPYAATGTSSPPETARELTGLQRAAAWSAVAGSVLLLVVFTVALSPDPANSRKPMWVPTQAGHCVAFLLMVLGLPAIAASLGRRLGVLGVVGYVALQTQLVLSTGSHVYLMWVVPILERHRAALGTDLAGESSPLHKYYTTHDAVLGVVLGLAMTGLVVVLWRCGRGMRAISALFTVGLIGEFLQIGPLGLGFTAIGLAWLGLRLARRGSVLAPLARVRSARTTA